jgi:hypothetical protein
MMKNIIGQAEIAIWDAAINLMSREKTPRVYSQTLAQMTLYLRPENPRISLRQYKNINAYRPYQWMRLGIIAVTGLAIGLLLGWLRSHL